MNRVLPLLILTIFTPLIIMGIGKTEESDYKQVSGKENWEYEVPIQDKEPGEYNLLIRAKDKANNEVFTGPYNIIVNEESDLPIVSITNPLSFMRVGGTLNIVGTARDDDGIGKVLIKINDGDYFEAVGKEFWSFLLEPENMTDGEHKITAKAVDINGLEGPEISVTYNQDTNKPKNTIESHKNGVIFSGKVKIQGKVVDANEIKTIELSIDNKNTFELIDFKEDKDEEFYTFEIQIDTEKLNDGPNIYWIRSIDKTESESLTPFLFFVDNIGPEITIIDPSVESSHNGAVTISGKIYDKIGVKNLSYIYKDIKEHIQIKDGNPYWSQKIDFSLESKESAKIEFISEDFSGNITNINYTINIDREADKPVLNLSSPVIGGIYKEDLIIEGSIIDDDLVEGLEYTIDDEEPTFIKTFNSFSEVIPNLTSGSHIIKIKAFDNNGTTSDYSEIEFEIDGGEPKIQINSVEVNEKEEIYSPGYEVTNDDGYSLLGTINSRNPISRLVYKVENRDEIEIPYKNISDGNISTFSLNINENFNYGINNFSILVTDIYGNIVEKKSEIYVKNYEKITDEWGLYYNSIPQDDLILLKGNEPFEMIFNGPNIKSVQLSASTPILDITFENNKIIATGKEDGLVEDIKFLVVTDKGTFETELFNIVYDSTSPLIELDQPKIESEQSNFLTISGNIKEIKLDKLEYKFSNEKTFTKLENSDDFFEQRFNTKVNIPDTKDESLTLEIKATDKFGFETQLNRTFLLQGNKYVSSQTREETDNNQGKLSDKPILQINTPLNNEIIFTDPILSGFTRDDDSVQSIKISEVGGLSKIYSVDGIFDIPLSDFGYGEKQLEVISIDINGTESKLERLSYTFDPNINEIKTDVNLGDILYKSNDLNLTGSIETSFKGVFSYKLGEDEFKEFSLSKNKFNIPLPNTLKWGRNNISYKFIDIYGRTTIKNSFFYILDNSRLLETNDGSGIYFNDNRLEDEFIDLSNQKKLIGYFNGRDIKTISLEGEKKPVPNFISVDYDKKSIIVKATENGLTDKIRVVVETVDGDKYTSDYYKFISDSLKPTMVLKSENNIFVKNSIIIEGEVRDNIKISSLEYSLNRGNSWTSLDLIEPVKPESKETYTKTNALDYAKVERVLPTEFIFNKSVDLLLLEDSGYTIWLRAIDGVGNEILEKRSFIKDNTSPELELFIPGEEEINGVVSIIGKTDDNIENSDVSYSFDGITFITAGETGVFSFDIDFGFYDIFPSTFVIRSTDKAGNKKEIYPIFNINKDQDKPTVEIQTPIQGEIIRNDFIISGMAFDDDRVGEIFYSLDGGPLESVAKDENNFSINIPLDSIENNEHIIRVKAVDILGVESDVISSNFWISKEEPTSQLLLPKIEDTKNGIIKLIGSSFDKNGIDSVFISTDNGVSYQKAIGQEEWNYTFNTKNIKDGTYSLFIKAVDKLETVGFYSTLINIDNTPPELYINEPVDGDILSDTMIFSGRSLDDVSVKEVKYKIFNHSSENDEGILIEEGLLGNQSIFNIDIPLVGYDEGEYNLELIALDQADNKTILSRNFIVTSSDNAGEIELLFPQSGSILTSEFEVSGEVTGRKKLSHVELYVDEVLFSEIKVNEFDYFNLKVNTFQIEDGLHNIYVKGVLEDGQIYETPPKDIYIKNSGEWLNIVNMKTGEYISGRPFLTGKSGFIPEDSTEGEVSEDNLIKPVLVEVSLDNGQIFEPATGTSNWAFRLETWKYEDGLTPILVRSIFSNGVTITDKIVVNIDRSQPELSILEGIEEGEYNESIKLSGIASDSNGLSDISVILRDGDKSKYEVPSLFQGMFIDAEVGYGKKYGVGVGLTFFDDNVKLQGTYGETRTKTLDARIKGVYYGFKLLANLYSINLSSIWGPDLEPFSMSVAVGASFTNKTLTISDIDSTMWFSAVVAQYEFFKMSFDSDYISSVALYLDLESTLISSESDGGFISKMGIGTRFTLF